MMGKEINLVEKLHELRYEITVIRLNSDIGICCS